MNGIIILHMDTLVTTLNITHLQVLETCLKLIGQKHVDITCPQNYQVSSDSKLLQKELFYSFIYPAEELVCLALGKCSIRISVKTLTLLSWLSSGTHGYLSVIREPRSFRDMFPGGFPKRYIFMSAYVSPLIHFEPIGGFS